MSDWCAIELHGQEMGQITIPNPSGARVEVCQRRRRAEPGIEQRKTYQWSVRKVCRVYTPRDNTHLFIPVPSNR
jgi:hypothetical protein